MTARTDTERVIAYFREHPGSTRGEAQAALNWIHVTARMSDARRKPHYIVFEKWRDDRGDYRFRVAEPRPVLRGETVPLW